MEGNGSYFQGQGKQKHTIASNYKYPYSYNIDEYSNQLPHKVIVRVCHVFMLNMEVPDGMGLHSFLQTF